jgi:hypothetical protein
MRRHRYASAMLAREGSGALAPVLAPSVEFDSAALHRPFVGKEAAGVTGMVRRLTGLVALTEAKAPQVVTLADGSFDIASPRS